MADAGRSPVLVLGLGNELRGDDGAGIEVVRRLRQSAHALGIDVAEAQNDPTSLIEHWRGRRAIVLVDALASGRPGAVRRWDASLEPLPRALHGATSTHAVGLDDAIELARVLDSLPARVVVYGVAGRDFETGGSISEEVVGALPELTERVLAEARSLVEVSEAP